MILGYNKNKFIMLLSYNRNKFIMVLTNNVFYDKRGGWLYL